MTDSYSYDAWGNVTNHTGESAQPYQFVGKLGYYTHVQDENLPLLHLGVRFYDAELGRFTQRDPVESNEGSGYIYAHDTPTHLTDPSGFWPTFEMEKSCIDLLGKKEAERQRATAEQYLGLVNEKYPGSNLEECGDDVIEVSCKSQPLGRTASGKPVCGITSPSGPYITVVANPKECGKLYCLMLHEAIHVCSRGMGSSGCWPKITVPGCGDIRGQHR